MCYRSSMIEAVLLLKEKVSRTYFSGTTMTATDYSKGRNLFIAEGCCANGIVTLTTGAFLSGYANSLGATDSINGIIGSIPVLLCTLQMFSSILLESLCRKKCLISSFSFIHRLLLASVFFVPLFIKNPGFRLAAVIGIYGAAHFFGAFIGTGTGNWILQLVPQHMRGNYLGKKDSFAFAFSTILSLIMGFVMDRFRSSSMEQTGFLVVGTVVFFIACTDFWCLSSISEPESQPHRQKLQDAVWKPLADREYRKVMLTYMFWNLALQIAGPFFSVYMVTGLKLDYTYITFLGLISSTVRVLAAWLWGRLADATSWLLAARCSMGMLGLVHASWFFMTPDTCYTLQPVLQALSGAAWGGIAISVFNLQYHYAPAEKRVLYVSSNSSYAGLCGFLSTLLGAFLLRVFPTLEIGGLPITGMQMLFLLSGILILGCVFYMGRLRSVSL
ncbi:MFS transporter [Lacrimispora sp.]|uniref:MFS transporter n=1 Tax=Lacrimispora sp. TaxID=2719234 RepID=UPI0028A21488|nr:MFS transporter [Lacrimispora sp.]